MKQKRCSLCAKRRLARFFNADSQHKGGLASLCVDCRRIKNRENYLANRDARRAKNLAHYHAKKAEAANG